MRLFDVFSFANLVHTPKHYTVGQLPGHKFVFVNILSDSFSELAKQIMHVDLGYAKI